MLKLLETLKDSAESTFDSAASRVENAHRLISGYVGDKARRLRGGTNTKPTPRSAGKPAPGSARADDPNIYDVVRGVNREIGEFGTDVFEIIDDARARRAVDKCSDPDDPGDND
jgi:hypothetical protein